MGRSRTNPAVSEASSSQSTYGVPRPLNLKCKIFISHSGRDKNFVRHLHDKLAHLYGDDGTVFFDEKTLPTAEAISMANILVEAEQCKLGVVVVTEDFFMQTPNPMLELQTFMTSNVRLLPLFLKMSVEEFKEMKHNNVWEEQWKEWLKGDEERLRVWKQALSFVDRFCGLEYCKIANNKLQFIGKVVDKVAKIVPANPFSEEGIQGRDHLCESVKDMYEQCASKRASDGCTQVASTSASAGRGEDNGESLDLVGIYGFAGLGKSTLCRCLCDFYWADFCGKVCWLNLGSAPDSGEVSPQTYASGSASMWRMEYFLSKLTGHIGALQYRTLYEIQNVLRNWIKKTPIFLAIDNIEPNSESSLEEVHFYLSCNFAKGSKIFITARSKNILEQVIRDYTRFSVVIKHIPKLKFEDARGIFVHEIPKLLQMENMEDEVKECVITCVIDPHHQHNIDDKWYHPLMLKVAAASIRHVRRHNVDLKSRLREFLRSATSIDKSDAWKKVFDMLDITFAELSKEAKTVFLNLSLFYTLSDKRAWSSSSYTWIRSVYSHIENLENIFWSLEDLSFIVRKEYYSYADPDIQVHGLMVDFAKYKARQGVAAAHYLVLDNNAELRGAAFSIHLAQTLSRNEWPSITALPKSVRTVSISGCSCEKGVLDLRNVEGMEVLHLGHNLGLREVLLSRTTLAHLRSFIVKLPERDNDNLRFTVDEDYPTPPTASEMMTGGKLAWVELIGNVILSAPKKPTRWWPWFGRTAARTVCALAILQPVLCNLQYLAVSYFTSAKSIDLTVCTNLKSLRLSVVRGLREIHGLETLTSLARLEITGCDELLQLRVPANFGLHTRVAFCASLERISLLKMSHSEVDRSAPASHGSLLVRECWALRNVDGIAQYTGRCSVGPNIPSRIGGMQETIRELLEPFETGLSKCKAHVTSLELKGYRGQGLAGLRQLCVENVQHVGLLVSALVKAQATHLYELKLYCKKGGDCGCDKNEPHFEPGLSSLSNVSYHCPRVRSLASLSLLGDALCYLSLRGCTNVEVWPDFATMTSLEKLDLSNTSLKELPTGVEQLLCLEVLHIKGCWRVPAEEMIKAITCKPFEIPICARGFLEILLDDLRGHRRDRGSVADALDSRWPELVALIHKQRRYLGQPYPFPILLSSEDEERFLGTELCFLIRLMYDLWFGVEGEAEAEAGSTYCACADLDPTVKEKMKRLLCTETFMSLPFYVWRIENTKEQYALEEWERYHPWLGGYESYMAFALIGSASIGCFNVSLNDDLKRRMVNFVQSLAEAQPQRAVEALQDAIRVPELGVPLTKEALERLAMRVGDAVCKMARAPSVAAALGQGFTDITMDGLKASYSENVESSEEVASESAFRWLNRTSYSDLEISREAFEKLLRRPIWEMWGTKVSMACIHNTMDDGSMHGARVLHKIMLKIQPRSFLNLWYVGRG